MTIDLPFGASHIPIEVDATRYKLLDAPVMPPLSDVEIGDALDRPIDSPPLDEIVGAGETVLIVVPDATRRAAAGQIVNLLVRRLIALGVAAYDISIIFATGIHRPPTPEEKAEIVTPFIAQRIKMLDHSPRDLLRIAGVGDQGRLVQAGTLRDGSPIELNRALLDFEHTIIVGGVNFHYFAGFGGGRKLICPGLASAETTSATHRLAFDFENAARAEGVGPGILEGNPVNEAFVEAVTAAPPAFSINTVVDHAGAAAAVFAGDWQSAHRAACDSYAKSHTIEIGELRPLVIASAGGSPYDIDMIQAHKALDVASKACMSGGRIVLLAECPEGSGRGDLMNWFNAADSAELGERLRQDYKVSGQTAWSILKKTEAFDVRLVSSIKDADASAMRMTKCPDLGSAIGDAESTAYVIPRASTIMVKLG